MMTFQFHAFFDFPRLYRPIIITASKTSKNTDPKFKKKLISASKSLIDKHRFTLPTYENVEAMLPV
jgi:hypothetical protein